MPTGATANATLRWPGGTARLGAWRGRPDVGFVAIGAETPAPPEVVDRGLEILRARGFIRVVTSALGPADALPFVDAGFAVHELLDLLARGLRDLRDLPPVRPTRRGRSGDHPAVLALDARSFDDFWALDDRGLADALRATSPSRFRVGAEDGRAIAYAITGRAGSRGYVQRLAVAPEHRRHGWGRALVVDALRWLQRHGAVTAFVNTQRHNERALDLYRSCGFQRMEAGLSVMGRDL